MIKDLYKKVLQTVYKLINFREEQKVQKLIKYTRPLYHIRIRRTA